MIDANPRKAYALFPMPLLNATVLGSLAGALHLYLRFLHNGQGEMYGDTGTADLPYAAILFFAAFVPVWLLTFGVGVTTRKILKSSIVDAAPARAGLKAVALYCRFPILYAVFLGSLFGLLNVYEALHAGNPGDFSASAERLQVAGGTAVAFLSYSACAALCVFVAEMIVLGLVSLARR